MKPQIIERYVYPKGTPISQLPTNYGGAEPNMHIPVECDGNNRRITVQEIDEYIANTHNYLTIEDKNELEQKIESIEITGDPNGVTLNTAQTITGEKTFAAQTTFNLTPECSRTPNGLFDLTNKEYVDDAIEKALSDIDVPSNITQQLETIQQDITEVKQDITAAEGEISDVKQQLTTVKSDVSEINQDITEINSKFNNYATTSSVSSISSQVSSIQSTVSNLSNELDDKQDKLVSGTNLKTVNGQSLLGSGNIQIETPEGGITDAPTDGKLYGRKSGAWYEVKQDFLTSTDKNELNSAIQGVNDNVSEQVSALSKKDSQLEGEIAQVGETVIGRLNNYLPLTGGTITGNLTVNGNVNNDKLVHTDITGGLNVVKVSQSEYNSGSKDANTLYIIVD